jgi:hypothetical protein
MYRLGDGSLGYLYLSVRLFNSMGSSSKSTDALPMGSSSSFCRVDCGETSAGKSFASMDGVSAIVTLCIVFALELLALDPELAVPKREKDFEPWRPRGLWPSDLSFLPALVDAIVIL